MPSTDTHISNVYEMHHIHVMFTADAHVSTCAHLSQHTHTCIRCLEQQNIKTDGLACKKTMSRRLLTNPLMQKGHPLQYCTYAACGMAVHLCESQGPSRAHDSSPVAPVLGNTLTFPAIQEFLHCCLVCPLLVPFTVRVHSGHVLSSFDSR